MTDFWPGQNPWNSFDHNPAWDDATDQAHGRTDDGDVDARSSGEPAQEVAFVQEAIQRVYHP